MYRYLLLCLLVGCTSGRLTATEDGGADAAEAATDGATTQPDGGAFDDGGALDDGAVADMTLSDGALAQDAAIHHDAAMTEADGALPPDADLRPQDAAPPPPDADLRPPLRACGYQSRTFDEPALEYDVMGASNERLRFEIEGVAAGPHASATLTFRGHDLDHPGTEGRIWVNGQGPLPIPAALANDNQDVNVRLDVSGLTAGGVNVIEFGSSQSEPRTFYRIGSVALEVEARIDNCVVPPEPPSPDAVERTIGYRDARYTQRQHWVIRCNDYAFTASGDEHTATDCSGEYRPGGPRHGKAIFLFENVARATYSIQIASRHTENRNPNRALFLVNGEGRRISQRSDRDRTTDVWGERLLEGRVEVVLDSTNEDQSDSIISVTLVPVR